MARNMSFNKHNVDVFFQNLEQVIKAEPKFADGARIYNLDETGTTTHYTPTRIIAATGERQLCKATSDERGTLTTTCCIIGASGAYIPPVMIFPRVNFQKSMLNGAVPGTLGLAAKNAWMNSDLFLEVLDHFIKNTNASATNPALLILDNHASHISLACIDKARENGVTLLTIPPHTSHRLQPLDVGVFRPFMVYYNEAMNQFMMKNPGKRVTIYNVAQFVNYAHTHALTPMNIVNSFRKCGIFPFDRNVFTDLDFMATQVTDREIEPTEESGKDVPVGSSKSDVNNITTNDATIITSTETSSSNIPSTSQSSHSLSAAACTSDAVKKAVMKNPPEIRPFPKASRAMDGTETKKRRIGKSMIATLSPVRNEIASKSVVKSSRNDKGKNPMQKQGQVKKNRRKKSFSMTMRVLLMKRTFP